MLFRSPESVKRPDYANNGEALDSISERWSTVWGGRVWGKAEEVARVIGGGLKEVRNRALIVSLVCALKPRASRSRRW